MGKFDKYEVNESIMRQLILLMEEQETIKGWGDSKQKLTKKFEFEDFNDAMKFVNKVAKIAERQNHHPHIDIRYDKVIISITDHEKGKVSDKCVKFVKEVNKL